MRRPTIRVAVLSMMSVLGVGILTLGFVAISGLSQTNEATKDIATNWLPSVSVVNAINTTTSDYRIAEGAHIMSTSEDEMAKAEADQANLANDLKALRAKYEPLISSDSERKTYERFAQEWADYEKIHAKVIELSRQNQNAEAASLFKGEAREVFDTASALLVELIKVNTEGSEASYTASQAAFSSTSGVTYGAGIVMVVLLAGTMYFAISGISQPINAITSSMKQLADGDDQSAVPFEGRSDEIGAMAAAVEVFRQNSLTNKRLEQEALANRSEAEKMREAEQLRVAREAEELRLATTALGENLKRLASGDLKCRINTAFAPAYENLRSDFNATVDQLSQTVSAVITAVGNMDAGTREIASGATDLSKRTEQQAAALEETAAALDEITVNVGSSSKMTEEARNVAQAATRSATASAGVVSDAENAMQRIEQSSQQISNIIGVIDEIAFQTNLLALNAGVEAARAGEAGKGFAVVAQEVRELAQRSAQAAKEIKGLIQNSTAEVESGVKLVRDTGEALKTIGEYITRINSHMEAIATSSREQSTGLSEVNVAVNQMDQTTQQNAAMVEQSTAAAASLSQEASKLRELVSLFQLDDYSPATNGLHVQPFRNNGRHAA